MDWTVLAFRGWDLCLVMIELMRIFRDGGTANEGFARKRDIFQVKYPPPN